MKNDSVLRVIILEWPWDRVEVYNTALNRPQAADSS